MGCWSNLSERSLSIHSQMRKFRGKEQLGSLYGGLLLLLHCIGQLGGSGSGQGINERFFGPAFVLAVEIYIIQSHSLPIHSSSDIPAHSQGL